MICRRTEINNNDFQRTYNPPQILASLQVFTKVKSNLKISEQDTCMEINSQLRKE